MSGKAPQRVGITQWIHQPSDIHLPLNEVTVGEAFQEAGYRTGYIGKWHLGEKDNQLPDHQGFAWTRGVNRAGQPGSYFHPFQRRRNKNNAERKDYWAVPDLDHSQSGDYLTDRLTDHALDFISDKSPQPFFLCFAHYAVHTPIQAPESLVNQYKLKKSETMTGVTPFLEERNKSQSRARQDDPTYAAMVNNLDTNVGRILKRIQSLNLAENTIILFTSDNGGLTTLPAKRKGPTSVLPLRAGKGWNYEGGIRVPTIIWWPGKIAPTVVSTPAITMDLYPTLLELAGLKQKPSQHVDGLSLVSAMNGQPENALATRFLGWTYPHNHGSGHRPSHAIREGRWKLIHHVEPQAMYELYDLKKDIRERKNLVNEQPEVAESLKRKLESWLKETSPTD